MRSVMVIAGTRPEVIKLSPVLERLHELKLDTVFVWSGQHYDYELSRVFFEQLKIPEPDLNLNVRSGSHAEQTAKAMIEIEKAVDRYHPSIVVAEGDTNTVAAAALAAIKNQVPFAHVEAGLRSFDKTMPEEVNRIVADSLSELLFAPTKFAVMNLSHEGIPSRKVHLTGNTVVDVITKHKDMIFEKSKEPLEKLGIRSKEYLSVTLHRQENINNTHRLKSIIEALIALSKMYKIVFTLHPRTKKKLQTLGSFRLLKGNENLMLIPPLGYIEFVGLLMNSLIVITDSGGIQEEALTLSIPTVTVRYNTERPETVFYGVNVLAGTETKSIYQSTIAQIQKRGEIEDALKSESNPFGDGNAGRRIADTIKDALEAEIRVESSDTRLDPYISYALVDSRHLEDADNSFEVLATYNKSGHPLIASKCTNPIAGMTLVRAPLAKIEKLPNKVATTRKNLKPEATSGES